MINVALFRNAEAENYSAGQAIFREGDPGTFMYVISEGEVDILVSSQLVETAGPGSIVGEMSLIDHGARSATALAKTDCKLVPIDQRRFQFLVQETPFFALQVMQMMAERLRRTNTLAVQARGVPLESP